MNHLDDPIFVAFDTETTGLSSRTDKLVQIAGVRFTIDGKEIGHFVTLANPGEAIGPDSMRIHGISDEMVRRAPQPEEACRQFASWLHPNDILAAHNAPFDVAFIATALNRGGHACPRNMVIDTLHLARSFSLPVTSHRLSTLLAHFGLPETGLHRALDDSQGVKALLLALIESHRRQAGAPDLWRVLREARAPGVHDMARTLNLSPRVAVLPEAILRGEIVRMRYDGESKNDRSQRVRPIELRNIDGTDYLEAQCMADGGIKKFRLDRIIGVDDA